MKITGLILVATFLGATAAFGTTAQATPAVADSSHISITAANWSFSPKTITVHVNQKTTLDLTSTAGVHGLQSTELGIPQTVILPGKTKSVTFVPTKVGTFVLHCTVPCGPGHTQMMLVIEVV